VVWVVCLALRKGRRLSEHPELINYGRTRPPTLGVSTTMPERHFAPYKFGRCWHRELKNTVLIAIFDLAVLDALWQSQRAFKSAETKLIGLIVIIIAAFSRCLDGQRIGNYRNIDVLGFKTRSAMVIT
jgi:hypothetical protein